MTDILNILKKGVIENLVQKNKRLDDRGFDEYRPITLEKNVLDAAEGSALVHMGKTKVLAAVKFDTGTPFPDRPEEGILSMSAEFLPAASPGFEPGPPGKDAIELARVVDRGIRAANIIDLNSFFIEEGKVLAMFVDIYVLDHHGNLIDASALAAMGAILSAKIPKIEDGSLVWGEYDRKLDVKGVVTTTTFYKIKDKILIDPNLDEETGASARLSVSMLSGPRLEDQEYHLCALQKGLSGAFRPAEIDYVLEAAQEKSKYLKTLLLKE